VAKPAFDLNFKIHETQITQIYADKFLNSEPIFTTRFARDTEDTEVQSEKSAGNLFLPQMNADGHR